MLRLRGKTSANLYYDKKRKVIGIKPLERKCLAWKPDVTL